MRYCQWLFALSLTQLGSGSYLISCLSWWKKPGLLSSKSPSSPPSSPSCQSGRSRQLRRGFVGLSQVKGSFSPPPGLAPVEHFNDFVSAHISPPHCPPSWWGGPWAGPQCTPRPRAWAGQDQRWRCAPRWSSPRPIGARSPGVFLNIFTAQYLNIQTWWISYIACQRNTSWQNMEKLDLTLHWPPG